MSEEHSAQIEELQRWQRVEGLDCEVSMPADTMLTLLALGDLRATGRQYTPAGGVLRALSALGVTAIMVPLYFFVLTVPMTMLGRLLESLLGLGPALAHGLLWGSSLGLGLLWAARLAWQRWRRPPPGRGDDPGWEQAFQCVARLAPTVGQGEVTFFHHARGIGGGWALEAALPGGSSFTARVEGPQGGRVVLETWLDARGAGPRRERHELHQDQEGRWEGAGQAPGPLPEVLAGAFARALMPGALASPARDHRLSLWHEIAPLTLSRSLSAAPEVDPPEGPVAELTPRPEAAVAQPPTRAARRSLWGGVISYWISSVAVLGAWSWVLFSFFPRTTLGLSSAWSTVAVPSLGFLFTLALVMRHRPPLPRRHTRVVVIPPQARGLFIDAEVLHTGALSEGIDLTRPFAVVLSREPRAERAWALLGVEVRQRSAVRGQANVLRFCVPVNDDAELAALEPLETGAPVLRPEDFRDSVWPLLNHRSEVLGRPVGVQIAESA